MAVSSKRERRTEARQSILENLDAEISRLSTNSTTNRLKRHRYRLFEQQGGRCCYCSREMLFLEEDIKYPPKNLATLEHLHSRLSSLRGAFGNGRYCRHAMACLECNGKRGKLRDASSPPPITLKAAARRRRRIRRHDLAAQSLGPWFTKTSAALVLEK